MWIDYSSHMLCYKHGFGYGYYLTFVLAGFASAVARQCRKHFRPHFVVEANSSQTTLSKRLYDITGTVATILSLNFITGPFFFSGLHDSLEIWRRVSWYGLWMIGLPFVFFQIFRPPHPIVGKQEEVKKPVSAAPVERDEQRTPGSEPFTVAPVHLLES